MNPLGGELLDNKIDMLLDHAITLIPSKELPSLPKNQFGDSQWHKYEHDIWAIGEEIRQILANNKAALSEGQVEKIIYIIKAPFANRGRQSFVWLLGKRQYAHLAPRIINQIYDDTISLHIFDSIYKMRAMGYEKEILDFQERFRPLASDRKKIQKYLNSFR